MYVYIYIYISNFLFLFPEICGLSGNYCSAAPLLVLQLTSSGFTIN